MAAVISENQQFLSVSGKPIVNGSIYIGQQGSDPESVPITIYSDRDLATVLANPQSTDSFGRSNNKIWIPGKYSIKVKDSDGVQRYIDLDAGGSDISTSGALILESVAGTNTITANAGSTITSYDDQQLYSLKIANTNTGSVTINIDGVGAKTLKRNIDQDVVAGQLVQDKTILFQYNSTADEFYLINENLKVLYLREGADIAAGSTVNLANATGNFVNITGSTTITSFGTVPAGAEFTLHFSGSPTITHNATSMILFGGEDYPMFPGAVAKFISEGSGNWRMTLPPIQIIVSATEPSSPQTNMIWIDIS